MIPRGLLVVAVAGSVVLTAAAPATAELDLARTGRISVASNGSQADAGSGLTGPPSLSATGRFVAFVSSATNLVPGDTNGFVDVFVRDRVTRSTTLVSVASDGTQADGDSFLPTVSGDGRYVAFGSFASNLVPGDTNGESDVFVRDRWAGTTRLISMSSVGEQGNRLSGDPEISLNGRFVTFYSFASNLVPKDTNGDGDVFVRDQVTNTTTLVSVATDGTQGDNSSSGPSISADGRYVAFDSSATNLVPEDTNGTDDVFVRDRMAGTTTRVSVATDGTQADERSLVPAISADGRFVAFGSDATNLVAGRTTGVSNVFVHDRLTRETTQASVANDGSTADAPLFDYHPGISANGRFVAFTSFASNLVPGDTNMVSDAFVRDRWAGTTTRTSVSDTGAQADDFSYQVAISAQGLDTAFVSAASNLVPGDTNGVNDVFIRRRSN